MPPEPRVDPAPSRPEQHDRQGSNQAGGAGTKARVKRSKDGTARGDRQSLEKPEDRGRRASLSVALRRVLGPMESSGCRRGPDRLDARVVAYLDDDAWGWFSWREGCDTRGKRAEDEEDQKGKLGGAKDEDRREDLGSIHIGDNTIPAYSC
jgi:hypothetical protein